MSVEPVRMDEEARNLLRVIVERQAYRQMMVANIRGHGVKFVAALDEKAELCADLSLTLTIYREIERLYRDLGGEDLALAVRSKMERIPYPGSRLELAVCLVLCDAAEQIAAESYHECAHRDFAAIARSLSGMDRSHTDTGADYFVHFCQDADNHPHARQMIERWLAITLRSLGRPGTAGDARAIQLGLRSRTCEQSVRRFIDRVQTFLGRCGLEFPDAETLGVVLPS